MTWQHLAHLDGSPFLILEGLVGKGWWRDMAWEAGTSGGIYTLGADCLHDPRQVASPLAYLSNRVTKLIKIFLIFRTREPCL